MHVPFVSEIEKQERANDIFRAVTWVLTLAAVAVAVMVLFSGCSTLFGEPAWTQPAVYAADRHMVSGTMVYDPTTGLVQQAAAVAQGTGTPWGIAIAGALGLLTTIVQTVRKSKSETAMIVEVKGIADDPQEMPVAESLRKGRTKAAAKILKAMKPKGV